MAKYFITFVLLAFLALENNSIYSRIHARSLSSDESEAIAHYMRQHQHHMANSYHQRQHDQTHRPHHHHQTHHTRPQQPNIDSSVEEEEDVAAAMHHYEHLQRHQQHQRQHLLQQQQHYQHPARTAIKAESPNLRTMPRIWQHLQQADDRMYGDAPAVANSEEEVINVQDLAVELPPSNILEVDSDESYKHDHNLNSNEDGTASKGCPKCESSRRVEHISEEELTLLRIEFVKEQILEKLRLKERPKVSAVSLPKPIYEGTTIEQEDDPAKNKELDDYYARTSKKFIFLQREKNECQRLGAHPSMCFSFKIDNADVDGFDVNTAVLWIFKNKPNKMKPQNNTILEQQTIVVSEVQQQLDSKYLPISKTIAIQSVDVQDEWMKIDIEWPIKRWFGNRDLSHLIHISCQSCDIDSMDEMISVDQDYRPFIMVDTQNRRRQSRQKRSINCTDGVTECCREKLYISFEEIGWGDWIIQPRGYDAYFCRGSCGSVASVTQSSSHHSTFVQKVLSTRRGNGRKPLELIPCCTAKQYSSLQLVFMDSNNTATQKTLPNMVVESCGCR